MVQNLKELIERAIGKMDNDVAFIEDRTMVVDCIGCGFAPQPTSEECLRCMVMNMSDLGGADKIVLRTGRDLEISGRTAMALRNLASLKKWSIPAQKDPYKCRRCNCSRSVVMTDLWDTFPQMEFSDAYTRLDQDGRTQECCDCMKSSIHALEQLETDIDRVARNLSG